MVLFSNAVIMGAAASAGVWLVSAYNKAEREVRLQRLEIDELKVALQVQGIKIHEGEAP